MSANLSDLHRAKRGGWVNESDPAFQDRFLKRLTEAYYEIRDNWGRRPFVLRTKRDPPRPVANRAVAGAS
jgi:hypothetical protein